MNTQQRFENAIFWIDTQKIRPNPYQPRREFDEARLNDLAESIKQYGILQPLTVSRIEVDREDGGISVEYELIAGERRLRASKIANLAQVPCIIRTGDDSKAKLELAIIENLQREDLNPVDRAKSFQRLSEEFSLKHQDIGKKISKSREYVSNTLRLLTLPENVLQALEEGKISEGHTRPLLMLQNRPEEQSTLFKEMLIRKMTVREAEGIARRIAFDKVRKKDRFYDPDVADMETRLAESLGTRVHIEKKEKGGKILIDFFSYEELQNILSMLEKEKLEKSKIRELIDSPRTSAEDAIKRVDEMFKNEDKDTTLAPLTTINTQEATHSDTVLSTELAQMPVERVAPEIILREENEVAKYTEILPITELEMLEVLAPEEKHSLALDDRTKEEKESVNDSDDIYNIQNFSI